jgi:hypothetical protein
MALIRGSAIFTQGSKVVSITSGGNAQYFDDNTVIFVDSDPARVVAVVSGTPTGFTLAENWSGETVSTTFTAWDTIEGLWDSVQTARTFKQQLEDANNIVASIANLYGTIAEGIAGTASGEYFSVVGTGDVALTLYLNNAGVAVEQNQLPSNSALALALTARDEAVAAALAASLSESAAADSESAAAASELAASDSALAASGSASAAAGSASAASGSASAAATSESNAADSASAALISENNAADSESAAAGSALSASGSASAASSSASDASDSADSAAASAGTATTQAGIATSAADTATTQAGIATTQAGIATTQAGLADDARIAAEEAESGAVAALDSFEGVYLGDLSADPAVIDSVTGQLYTNIVSGKLRYFDGTNWTNSTPDGDYLLL